MQQRYPSHSNEVQSLKDPTLERLTVARYSEYDSFSDINLFAGGLINERVIFTIQLSRSFFNSAQMRFTIIAFLDKGIFHNQLCGVPLICMWAHSELDIAQV